MVNSIDRSTTYLFIWSVNEGKSPCPDVFFPSLNPSDSSSVAVTKAAKLSSIASTKALSSMPKFYVDKVQQTRINYVSKRAKFNVVFEYGGNRNVGACVLSFLAQAFALFEISCNSLVKYYSIGNMKSLVYV